MIFKSGVVIWEIHPKIEELLQTNGWLDQLFMRRVGRPCIITSVRDGVHGRKSWHYKGRAIDIRTNDIDDKSLVVEIHQEIKAEFDEEYDIVLEWLGRPQEHIHVEYDPH